MFGKARAMEALIQNKSQLDDAVKAYEELNERFPHGMFKPLADQRISRLNNKKKDALAFYEALAQYVPKAKVESPRSQLEKIEAAGKPAEPTAPVRPGSSAQPAPAAGPPEPSLTPTEPVKANTPKTEPPKAAPGKADPAKPQPAKAEPPKAEPAKPQPAKPEAPKTEAPKTDSPKAEAPKPDAAKKASRR